MNPFQTKTCIHESDLCQLPWAAQYSNTDDNNILNNIDDAFCAQIDTSNWENVRGPRPWEEGNKLYEEAKERAKKMGVAK